MRFYLGSCEYKWTHTHSDMEYLWIRRELGEELFKTIEINSWNWVLLHSDSQSLPADIYCRCDIFIEISNSKQATHFMLKYPQAKLIETV